MIGLAADDGAERDQRIVLFGLRELHERKRNLERAGNGHLRHVLIHHAELAQLVHAGLELTAAGIFIEARNHNADAQIGAVGRSRDDVNCHLRLL